VLTTTAPTGPLLDAARDAAGSLDGALDLARAATAAMPPPGEGATAERWRLLADLGAVDLTVARVLEAHLDAVAILREAARSEPPVPDPVPQDGGHTWGVFAAESPGTTLHATQASGSWRLDGRKPWCSAAGRLDRALVTARAEDGPRLFAVDLTAAGVLPEPAGWISRGLAEVPSGPVRFEDAEALPVGPPGWYLDRPGMAWGGMGVAAVWYGGAVGVARRLWRAAVERPPDDIALLHLGATDAVLHATRCTLDAAAAAVDAGSATGPAGRLLAQRVRGQVARCVDEVLARVGHGLGPGPLTGEEEHARRVADLQVYVRQQHAERDDRATGALLHETGTPPW
jgi:alkylation response protein AidB-like acyl-CoA dehydrogenase